jgi:4'-phosphopantetheinyl transferase
LAGRALSSSIPAPRQALGPDEVHIWRLRADDVAELALLEHFEALLSPDESERYACISHARTRREFLLARVLARTVLASYTGIAAGELRFQADAFGKPMLLPRTADPCLHFNISHSHGVIMCAAAVGRQVGIDVEDASRHVEFLDLAERYFAPAAESAAADRPPARRRTSRGRSSGPGRSP